LDEHTDSIVRVKSNKVRQLHHNKNREDVFDVADYGMLMLTPNEMEGSVKEQFIDLILSLMALNRAHLTPPSVSLRMNPFYI
jgi:hypothetical protein